MLQVGDLTLDPATREVWRGAGGSTLTTREYALLEYFMRNPGRVLTRPMLAEHVWGLDFDPESNIVDVYVGYLRRKIDGPDDPRLLHTVRGAGYVLEDRRAVSRRRLLPLSIHTRLTLWYAGACWSSWSSSASRPTRCCAWSMAQDVDRSLLTVADVMRDAARGPDAVDEAPSAGCARCSIPSIGSSSSRTRRGPAHQSSRLRATCCRCRRRPGATSRWAGPRSRR